MTTVGVGLCTLLPLIGLDAATANTAHYQYLSPLPGAKLVSPENNIIVRYGAVLDASSLDSIRLQVTGTTSGVASGELRLADDSRTLLFQPHLPFALGERVRVDVSGGTLPALDFSFTVAENHPREQPRQGLELELETSDRLQSGSKRPDLRPVETLVCDSLVIPDVVVGVSDGPAPGRVFTAPFTSNPNEGHLLILDDQGQPLFYRALPHQALDFKRQPNGLLTYGTRQGNWFYALDSCYVLVDSFATGNGYLTDFHDLLILDNGHALLMSYDPQPVGMDTVVVGGDPNATVTGLIVQELDAARNVVFQWRSWDHFAITDASVSANVDLLSDSIDYVHGNALELDTDGNILVSSRHMNEITKIDRQTGDVLWRLGAHAANNEFTIVGDARGFSHQHDIRRLANGHITLFDNGNYLTESYSRAVEYQLDEVGKVATLVWEYRPTPDVYSTFMGNVQRLPDGGTVVGWGGWPSPNLTEVRSDDTTSFELSYPAGTFSYRSFRFPWSPPLLVADADTLDFGDVELADSTMLAVTIRNVSTKVIPIDCYAFSEASFSAPSAPAVTLLPGDSIVVDVRFEPALKLPYTEQMYVQSVGSTEMIALAVNLKGNGVYTPTATHEVAPRRFALHQNHPNPFNPVTSIDFEVPRRTHVHLAVYDANGRLVDTLVDEPRDAGRYQMRWHVPQEASGVYFYRLRAGAFDESRKFVLLK